jgi:hypothetical protein
VNAGVVNGYPPAPLPTGYWTRPINTDNRDWYQISGDWLQQRYDASKSCYNPYTTGPDSPHIIWKTQVSTGGIIGGDWGSLSYPAGSGVGGGGGTPSVVMTGRVYINKPGAVFDCYDLRTGELLYEAPGTISVGQHLRATSHGLVFQGINTPETQSADVNPYLWETSTAGWKIYNPWNGALLQTITGVPAGLTPNWFDGDPTVYCIQQVGWNTTIQNRLATNNLIRWDYTKVTGNNWTTGIVWNVSLKQPDGTGPGEGGRTSGISIWNDVGVVRSTGEDFYYAYNLTTGQQLYVKQLQIGRAHV